MPPSLSTTPGWWTNSSGSWRRTRPWRLSCLSRTWIWRRRFRNEPKGCPRAWRPFGSPLHDRDPDLRFVVEDRLHGQPPEAIRLILFRVAQEALANVRKHAKATRVDVLISERDGGYFIRVRDNGVGFDSSEIRRSREGHL